MLKHNCCIVRKIISDMKIKIIFLKLLKRRDRKLLNKFLMILKGILMKLKYYLNNMKENIKKVNKMMIINKTIKIL